MPPKLRTFLAITAAALVAFVFAVVGGIIRPVPGALIGAWLGSLLVGRARGSSVIATSLAWLAYAGIAVLIGIRQVDRLTEVASFGATMALFVPGGFVGGLGAGLVEGLAARRNRLITALVFCLAHGVGTTLGGVLFRLGAPLAGAVVAAAIYAAGVLALRYGATTAV